jgi:polysaccharide export outer membrane protein
MKKLVIALVFSLMSATAFAGDYVIGEGDGLDIAVWGVKDLTFSVKVRPDGKITVPGLGDVPASAMTPSQLQASLGEKLKELVKNPIVTVTVRDITNSKVYIFGGGVKSGIYSLNQRSSLLQFLCVISDVKAADLKKAYVLRKGQKIKENFYPLFIDGDIKEDIEIETNDVIFLPPLLEKNIYVVGAVNAPKAIEYREGLTVLSAILEAGSFTKYAKENNTVIIRKDGDKEISIPVKAKDLITDGDLSQNVKLKVGDYVIVKEGMF